MGIDNNPNTRRNGWTEYGQLVLAKLEELHSDHREVKRQLEHINERLARGEAAQKDLRDLEQWQKEVTETWSPMQMKEAKDELYKQKEKWTGAWFVFVAIQIIWSVLMIFKDKIFK
jgi:hypothetical protein